MRKTAAHAVMSVQTIRRPTLHQTPAKRVSVNIHATQDIPIAAASQPQASIASKQQIFKRMVRTVVHAEMFVAQAKHVSAVNAFRTAVQGARRICVLLAVRTSAKKLMAMMLHIAVHAIMRVQITQRPTHHQTHAEMAYANIPAIAVIQIAAA